MRADAEVSMNEVTNPTRQLIVTPQNEGTDGHTIGTNLILLSQLVFDWLDEAVE